MVRIKCLYYRKSLNLSCQHLEPWLERAHIGQENKSLKYFSIINYPDLLFSNLPSSGIRFTYLISTSLTIDDEKITSICFKTNPITNFQLQFVAFLFH